MRATVRVEDRRIETAMVAFGFLLFVLSFFSLFRVFLNGGHEFVPAGVVGIAMIACAPLFRGSRRRRQADVDVVRGALVVRTRGRLRHRFSLRALTGASTARLRDRVALALRFGNALMPIVLELANEKDAKTMRAALDVGPTGMGALVWQRGRDLLERLARPFYWLAMIVILTFSVWTVVVGPAHASAFPWEMICALVFVVAKAATTSSGPGLSLAGSGVYVTGAEGGAAYPWSSIAGIEVEERAFALTLEEQRDERFPAKRSLVRISHERLDADDLALIAEQIRAASERVRGRTRVDEQMVESLLRPREDESTIDWINRLDALADGWRVSPPRHGETEAYRAALWATLEDHDADPIVRALATRVLSRLDREAVEHKLRVAIETVRDPKNIARLRAAVAEDSEPLAAAIEQWKRGA